MLISIWKTKSFTSALSDVISWAKDKNQKEYLQKYKNTKFTLYGKYSYFDVSKCLGYEKDLTSVMGGYFYHNQTNTYCVFINYEKSEDSILYNDRFVDSSHLIAHSKKNRKLDSNDAQIINNAEQNNTPMYLFVRKNKDDKKSKDFYFLGQIHKNGDFQSEEVDGKPAFTIPYKLETPVREDIYEYLTALI